MLEQIQKIKDYTEAGIILNHMELFDRLREIMIAYDFDVAKALTSARADERNKTNEEHRIKTLVEEGNNKAYEEAEKRRTNKKGRKNANNNQTK